MTHHDEARFTALFDRHREAVHAYLLGRSGSRAEAADLVQETFLRLWRRLPEVDAWDDDRQRAWLFTVARNLAIDAHRRSRARPQTSLHGDAARVPAPDHDAPADRAVQGDALQRLDDAIRRLPEHLRTVLSLATVAGMTSAEIGTALNLPPGTVRSHLHEARQRLAAAVKEETA